MRHYLVTAGANYLDIDAYACCLALAELLQKQGRSAFAYSSAPLNYTVCRSLIRPGMLLQKLPEDDSTDELAFILVDVSDPHYLERGVAPEQVVSVYDHHVGYENYWADRLGAAARISFIGAAATLVFQEWQRSGLLPELSRSSAELLAAGILENTLNLNAGTTTDADREAVEFLCETFRLDDAWRSGYFSQVQAGLEADLPAEALRDVKTVSGVPILPDKIVQLCVWDTERIVRRLPELRVLFDGLFPHWMLNLVDIQHKTGRLICFDEAYRPGLEDLYGISFQNGAAEFPRTYLRKELMKRAYQRMKQNARSV